MAVITVPGYVNAAVALACGPHELLHSYLRQLPADDVEALWETIGALHIAIAEARSGLAPRAADGGRRYDA